MIDRARRLGVQVVEREADDRAFLAQRKKAAGGGRRALVQFVEGGFHSLRVELHEHRHPAAAIAETIGHRLGKSDLARKAGQFVALVRRDQQQHVRRAVGEGRGEEVEADLGRLVDREGQHPGRKPVAEAGGGGDQVLAVARVVDQQDGRRAAGIVIGPPAGCAAAPAPWRPAACRSAQPRSGRRWSTSPQPPQTNGSIATVSPSGRIAEAGQTSRQRVQPASWLREWAHSPASKAT